MNTRAVLYTRISRDTVGEGAGVERQRQDCVALCERRGWDVGEVVIDNDLSAFSGKHRPGYARVLDLIGRNEVDVLVAWHPDRLHRSPKELERFVELVESHSVAVATVTAGDVDLSTPEGRLMARITGAVARKESEDKSRRLRRKHQEIAQQGRVSGGGNRPFGFEADRVAHNKSEVRLIREAAKRVLAGESLYGIVNDWTERGVPTVTGAPWTTTHVRTFLLAPRVVGLRVHDGVEYPAVWKPILDRETWEQVGRALRSRSRARTRPARVYVLSGGLLRCGECDAAMVAAPRPTGRAYACLAGHGGCNKVSIMADPVEQLVIEAALLRLDTPTLDRAIRDNPGREDADAGAELQAVEGRLAELAEMFAAGEIGRTEWRVARERLEERREALEVELSTVEVNPLDAFAGKGKLRKAWPDMTVDQQRTILAAIIEKVTIASAARAGGRTVDLGRVDVTWRV